MHILRVRARYFWVKTENLSAADVLSKRLLMHIKEIHWELQSRQCVAYCTSSIYDIFAEFINNFLWIYVPSLMLSVVFCNLVLQNSFLLSVWNVINISMISVVRLFSFQGSELGTAWAMNGDIAM